MSHIIPSPRPRPISSRIIAAFGARLDNFEVMPNDARLRSDERLNVEKRGDKVGCPEQRWRGD